MPGVASAECPVSLITPETRALVELAARERALPGALGPPHELPARFVDALIVIREERDLVELELSRAESRRDDSVRILNDGEES